MSKFLELTTHSDGDIALFNDSTLEIAAPTEIIINYAAKLGLSPLFSISPSINSVPSLNPPSNQSIIHSFPQTGFSCIQKRSEIYLIIDLAVLDPIIFLPMLMQIFSPMSYPYLMKK